MKKAREEMPPIEAILNLQDMEDLAEKVLSRTGWAYYRSAADSEDCESSGVLPEIDVVIEVAVRFSGVREADRAPRPSFQRIETTKNPGNGITSDLECKSAERSFPHSSQSDETRSWNTASGMQGRRTRRRPCSDIMSPCPSISHPQRWPSWVIL